MKLAFLFILGILICVGNAATAQPALPALSVPYNLPTVHHGSVDFGDMEGDGKLDLAISGITANRTTLSVWHLGDSTFQLDGDDRLYRINVYRRVSFDAVGVSHGAVRWGDYDGDRDDDLLVTGLNSHQLFGIEEFEPRLDVYENNGMTISVGRRTIETRRIELPGLYRSAADWGDFDGDGDLDFVAAGLPSLEAEEPVLWLYRNDEGSFVRSDAALPGVFSGDLAWADYDEDGDPDLAIMGDSGSGVFITHVYRNDGGQLVETGIELQGLAFGSLSWGDYDRDGDPDLLQTGGHLDPRFLRGTTRVYRNDGGTLVDGDFDLEGHVLGMARWGDADRDGDLDIFAVGAPEPLVAGVLHLYTNNGSRFVPTWNATGMINAAIDVGDYNGDRDADAIVSGELSLGGARTQFLMNRHYFECVAPSWVPLFQSFGICF